jgi:hypothetical protein
MASQLADNISPELHDDLVWVAYEATERQKTREWREYWQSVRESLTE